MLPETIGQSSIGRGFSRLSSIAPTKLDLVLSGLISAVLIGVANIKSLGETLGINEKDQESFNGLIKEGYTLFIDKLDSIPLGDTVVVFIINFFIVLFIINVASFALRESKVLKADVAYTGQGEAQRFVFYKKLLPRVMIHLLQKIALYGFAVAWGLIFIFFMLPIGIKVSNQYLKDISEYKNIFFLMAGFFIIMVAVLICSIYARVLNNNLRYK